MHIVTDVMRTRSTDGSHAHISELVTQGAIRYTREEVIDSIRRGERWSTLAEGSTTDVQILTQCPWPGCTLRPYLQTQPGANARPALEPEQPA
jgi:hypothetical protein